MYIPDIFSSNLTCNGTASKTNTMLSRIDKLDNKPYYMHTSQQPVVHYLRYLSAKVFAPNAASLSLCQPCFAIIYQQVSD